ncbi:MULTISPECIES: RHS repeat-associated core domain-containing protein [unclassified Pseudomonas]|uniref:RHS repeat-associated core domain-containing protein n=1 Tax=unclassified Pseudomonas TaxID=196821 RepID=UPI0009E89B15|nr:MULTISPECIES: RHS repeat-associated core domain-containing protein [unclassified Pseudomonas]
MALPHETVLCQYRYDALDRLVGQTPAATPEHQRFYNQSRLATEIQGAMRHSIFQQGDLLLAQQRNSVGVIDTSLLATDQQRSVLHTCKVNQQRNPIAYSPYGHRPAENGLLSLLGFNGERRNPVTGHYLLGNGYRAFNPVLMRFNSPDSLSPFREGGVNPYAYCQGAPVNQTDPTGHATSLGWGWVRNSIVRRVPRPTPWPGFDPTMLPDAPPPRLNRAVAAVEPILAVPPVSEVASLNVTNTLQLHTVDNGREFIGALESASRSPDRRAQLNPAMRVALGNMGESSLTAVRLPTPTEEAARTIALSGNSNRHTPAFETHRRTHQQMEGRALRENRPDRILREIRDIP